MNTLTKPDKKEGRRQLDNIFEDCRVLSLYLPPAKRLINSDVTRICCEEGHSRWISGPDAAAARWLIVL